jgi:molybdate transport system substrate-binding protein
MSLFAKCAATAIVIGAHTAHCAEIKVIAANAVKEPYLEIVAAFEKSSGHKVTTIWTGTENATKRMIDGAVFDIALIAAPNLVKFLTAPEAGPIIKKIGMEPG